MAVAALVVAILSVLAATCVGDSPSASRPHIRLPMSGSSARTIGACQSSMINVTGGDRQQQDHPYPAVVDKPVRSSTVVDEPLEKLVARRIREQLGEGGLERLIDARRRIEGQAQELQIEVGLEATGEVQPAPAELKIHGHTPEVKVQAAPPGDVIAVIESASPELAGDLRSRSPQDINLAINLFMAIMQILQVALMLYQMVHGEPPSQQQVIQIFNHTTNVIKHTTNVVVNMAPDHG
jgi:hypothetical protein